MFRRILKSPATASLWVFVVVCGCEQPGSGPGTTVAFDRPADPTATTKPTQIVMILPAENTDERLMWAHVGRTESGMARAIFDVRKPQPGDPPTKQAELVREAVERGASALIVVAEDAPSIAPALAEARDKGVAVVLLDRPVAVPGRPLPLVTRLPFDAPAKELVAAAVQEAKAWEFPPEGPAVILVNSRVDNHTADRVAAFEKALKEAGVTLLETAQFGLGMPNPYAAEATATVVKLAEAHPKIAIILATDEMGITGADIARESLGERGQYVVVGFSPNPKSLDLVGMRQSPALVDTNVIGVARQAVQTALRLVRGETVPDRTEVEFKSRHSTGKRTSERPPYAREVPSAK